jgi:hypothetical protein
VHINIKVQAVAWRRAAWLNNSGLLAQRDDWRQYVG